MTFNRAPGESFSPASAPEPNISLLVLMRPSRGRVRREIIWVILLVNFQACPLSCAPESFQDEDSEAPFTRHWLSSIIRLSAPSVLGCWVPIPQGTAGKRGQEDSQRRGRHSGRPQGHWPHPGLPPLDSLTSSTYTSVALPKTFTLPAKGGFVLL